METEKWILCPACGGKTRNRIRKDTLLLNYPLYCPKCKQETLIAAKDLRITVVERPDAQTQSRWTRKISCGSPALSIALIWIVRQIKKTELWRAVLSCLYIALQTRFEFGGIFMCWSAVTTLLLIRSSDYLHGTAQPRGWSVKKIHSGSWPPYTLKVEPKSLHNRICFSFIRNGLTAFADFFVSLFVRKQDKPTSGIGCRSPPTIWISLEIQIDRRK